MHQSRIFTAVPNPLAVYLGSERDFREICFESSERPLQRLEQPSCILTLGSLGLGAEDGGGAVGTAVVVEVGHEGGGVQGDVQHAVLYEGSNGNDADVVSSSSGAISFDGSKDVTGKLILTNTGISAGTYSAAQFDSKGRAIAGAQVIEWGDNLSKQLACV